MLKSPLIIHSALILCRSLNLNHVLICSTLYPPGSCSNFETGTLLKTSKGPAKLIANCFFFHTALLQTLAEMAHVCLSLRRGHLKTSKGPAKLIANCFFFHTALLQTLAEMAHVCLSLRRGHV